MFLGEQGIPVFIPSCTGKVVMIARDRPLLQQIPQSDVFQVVVVIFPSSCPSFESQLRLVLSIPALDLFEYVILLIRDAPPVPIPVEGFLPWKISVHITLEMTFAEIGSISARILHDKPERGDVVFQQDIVRDNAMFLWV
jgi:hypothetical protein